jgi:hypothetical protein
VTHNLRGGPFEPSDDLARLAGVERDAHEQLASVFDGVPEQLVRVLRVVQVRDVDDERGISRKGQAG